MGWISTLDIIEVSPAPKLPFGTATAYDFEWDVTDPYQWVLSGPGLPLSMGKDEVLQLPTILLRVKDANDAGARFAQSERCLLVIRLAIRTGKGSPSLPDQSVALTQSDAGSGANIFAATQTFRTVEPAP